MECLTVRDNGYARKLSWNASGPEPGMRKTGFQETQQDKNNIIKKDKK